MKQFLRVEEYGKKEEVNFWNFIQKLCQPVDLGGIPADETKALFGTEDVHKVLKEYPHETIKKAMHQYYSSHPKHMENIREFVKKYAFIYDVDGKSLNYDVVSRNTITSTDLPDIENAVAIIPVFEDGDLLMIREFRYPVNDYVWAFPAGLIDPGEDAEAAAVRELWEETGVNVDEILSVFPGGYSSEGMTDEKLGTVVCRISGELNGCDGAEEIHPVKVTVEEAMRIAKDPNNKISNKIQIFLAGLLMNR